ncbi:MAG: M56 family metallopeptidase, partial [Bacteroidota bacterium]
MPELLSPLATWGAWSLSALWLPVAVWTVAVLLAEGALRLRPGVHPLVSLGVRRSLLWALPATVVAALVVPGWFPAAVPFADAVPASLTLPTLTVGATPDAPLAPEAAPVPWAELVAGAALVVAHIVGAVRLIATGIAVVRLRRLSAGTHFNAAVQREAARIGQREGLRRPVLARVASCPTVPYTYGWRRPVVVVPEPLATDLPRLRLALAHEIAHVARGDFASGVAERVIGAVFGWHPL